MCHWLVPITDKTKITMILQISNSNNRRSMYVSSKNLLMLALHNHCLHNIYFAEIKMDDEELDALLYLLLNLY